MLKIRSSIMWNNPVPFHTCHLQARHRNQEFLNLLCHLGNIVIKQVHLLQCSTISAPNKNRISKQFLQLLFSLNQRNFTYSQRSPTCRFKYLFTARAPSTSWLSPFLTFVLWNMMTLLRGPQLIGTCYRRRQSV